MRMRTRLLALPAVLAVLTGAIGTLFAAPGRDQVPPWPADVSPMGMHAAISNGVDARQLAPFLSEDGLEAVKRFYSDTKALGGGKRIGTLFVPGPTNVKANTNVGDAVGETQSEISICVLGDTVVVGWNDSRGFVAGNTLSSTAYSTDGGATFVDMGNVPLALATDQAFGDTGIDTDEKGNWYLNSIYTRAAGAPGPTAQQNIGVHRGVFTAGVLAWQTPTMASIGTAATGNLDKCLLACDRVTNNVYVAYTRFTATPQIEIVRSIDQGATWLAPTILDNTLVPTSSKQAARPFCGPGGEVYVVWEKGANSINCPDGAGNVTSFAAQIAFTRSLDFGVTYDPFSIIGNPVTGFLAAGPGDLRERANEFPDIAVDVSSGCYRGNLYVTWHEAAPWSTNTTAGPVKIETGVNNNNPGTPDLFVIGDDATGAINPAGDLDYWRFSATQGQDLMIDLLPQGFVCGVTGTTRQMRMRLFAVTPVFPNPTGFPDSMLAASFIGAFENRIVWTAPRTGDFLVRLQISGGTSTGTYTLRVRPLTFTPGASRDARDVVVVRSSNQGTTWSAPQLINDDAAGLENRRPFITVNNKGHVAAYWHDSRDAGFGSTASLTHIFGTTSRDGGVTWSPNYCVTDEASFFSFNTLAIPNLGDYNTASAGQTDVFHPAWTDQRISTGDVRTPGTNTYTAGRGPEAYTTGIRYASSVTCPEDSLALPGTSVMLEFEINNLGNIVDSYSWSASDDNGYMAGPANGTAGPVAAGGSSTVQIKLDIPIDCQPDNDVVTFSYTPAGEGCYAAQQCQVVVQCDDATLDVESAGQPFSFGLAGRNPVVSGSASLRYTLPIATHVRIDVYSVSGQRLRTLVDRAETAGAHTVDFPLGRAGLNPGVYLVRIEAGTDHKVLRVVAID